MDYAILWIDGTFNYSIPILGKPMIEYSLEIMNKLSFQNIICVLDSNKYDYSFPTNIKCVFRKNLNNINEIIPTTENILILSVCFPFLSVQSIEKLIQQHSKNQNEITIGTIRFNSPLECDRVNIDVKQNFAGCMCVRYDVLKSLLETKDKSIFTFIENISSNYSIFEIEDSLETKRINDLCSLSLAEAELQNCILQKHLLAGVHIENENTITIGPDVSFLGEAYLRSGSILLGKTIIYPNVTIGPNSEIVDSILYDSVKVMHSVIMNSCVGEGTTIGPFSHIRNQSFIGKNNRIGNFVEFKNTTTGNKTYASHLAYVGDTECGSGVNFGCGIVTVNYDGVNKHKTIIGNNVFIGCNSNLIAPIEIGSNSYIAAGSTITSSLVEGDFAIARTKQITKTNYANKFHYKRVDEE